MPGVKSRQTVRKKTTLDHFHHVIDVLGGTGVLLCWYDVELGYVVEECVGKFVGQLLHSDSVPLHSLNDFVIDIREVTYVIHVIAAVQEPSLDQVVCQEGSEVADVRKIVDCWSTGIHADFAWLDHSEWLLVSG
jgi:hypothetical protein